METGCSLTDTHAKTHALHYTPAHTETEEEGINTENHIKLHGLKHERTTKQEINIHACLNPPT